MKALPDELREADARYHALLASIRFSRHLNPANAQEARVAFEGGREAPPFEYHPTPWADDAIATLDGLRIPREHPLGVELAAAVAETRQLTVALRHRRAEDFEALATLCDWWPEDHVEEDVLPARPGPLAYSAEDMFHTLAEALGARGLSAWEVRWDPVMASRVLVDASKREVRVNPAARFRAEDLVGLVAHEIDVHVARGAAGEAQPLKLFSTGLARAGLAEEGLAILAEERAGTLSASFVTRQALVAGAIRRARDVGFRELYDWLASQGGAGSAWGIALRVKRGLGRPEAPGVFAKDAVYLRGWRGVRAYLAQGGELAALYVGKVGLHHPVGDWIAEGWVRPGEVPAFWASPAPG
ncbi:MAG: tyrosine/phenylalanine carboxypeptidase domain-containing protein [Myxococcota bacterium]